MFNNPHISNVIKILAKFHHPESCKNRIHEHNAPNRCFIVAHPPWFGSGTHKKLINHFGSPEKVWGSPPNKWLAVKGIGEKHSFDQALVSPNFDRIKKEEKFILDQGIQTIYYGHQQYPKTLAFISDPPPVCFYKGKVDWSNPRIISIVGTRKPTQEGIDQC